MKKGKRTHAEAAQIIEATVAKLTELGPHNEAGIKLWLKETYGFAHYAQTAYLRRAGERCGRIYNQDPKQLVSEMVAKLDTIIYGANTTPKSVIEAIRVKANLLGLWRVALSGFDQKFEPMSAGELLVETDTITTCQQDQPEL